MAELVRPASFVEALELIGEGCVPVSGGTALMTLLNLRLLELERFVALTGLPELDGVEQGAGGVRIGASTRLSELASSELVRRAFPHVALAASHVGNPRVRAQARLGGALAHADPRQDLPPALIASRAVVVCRSRAGIRTVPIAEFFRGYMETALGHDELVSEVRLPAPVPVPTPGAAGRSSSVGEPTTRRRVASGYLRFAPGSPSDFPTVSAAVSCVRDTAGRVTGLDLALGSVGPVPLSIDTAPLVGAPADPDLVDAAVGIVTASVAPAGDRLGSAEYRRFLAGVVAGRLLCDVLAVPRSAVRSRV